MLRLSIAFALHHKAREKSPQNLTRSLVSQPSCALTAKASPIGLGSHFWSASVLKHAATDNCAILRAAAAAVTSPLNNAATTTYTFSVLTSIIYVFGYVYGSLKKLFLKNIHKGSSSSFSSLHLGRKCLSCD